MTGPVIIENIFSDEELLELREMLSNSDNYNSKFYDDNTKRWMISSREVTEIFGKKLEAHVQKVFDDDSIEIAFAFYCIYDTPDSYLPEHRDRNACDYNVSYTLSQREPWAFTVNGIDYYGEENSGIFYSGTKDYHSRSTLGPTGNDKVEMLFFHFVPRDHWYNHHCEDVYPSGV